MAVAANVIKPWKGAVEPAESGASGNEIKLWKGAVEPAATVAPTPTVARKGGVRWLHEPEPLTREEIVKELRETVALEASPGDTGATITAKVTLHVPKAKKTRVERLLADQGLTLEELLMIL